MLARLLRYLSNPPKKEPAESEVAESYASSVASPSSRELGRGGYGIVYAVTVSGHSRAVKRVPHTRMATIRREILAFNTLSPHPNIIGFFGVEYETESTLLILELAQGELFHVVDQNGTGLDEPRARSFYTQMMAALTHIHALGVAHRDIKLENWLVSHPDQIKLADFGLAHVYDRKVVNRPALTESVGSRSYCLPEILIGQRYDGVASDLWSTNICLFAMCAGFFPYEEACHKDWRFRRLYNTTTQLVSDIYALYNRECTLSADLCSLLHSCIGGPRRLSLSEMKSHPWTTGKPPRDAEVTLDSVVWRGDFKKNTPSLTRNFGGSTLFQTSTERRVSAYQQKRPS